MQSVYSKNLKLIWDSLLPAPDIQMIQKNGTIKKIEQTFKAIALHYLTNIAKLTISLVALPFTYVLSTFEKTPILSIHDRVETHIPKAFGFASSGFQDGGIGTNYDPSSLKGIGTCDWNKILNRPPQTVTKNGTKVAPFTHGITLAAGEKIEDLFVNTIDHPEEFVKLLKHIGCTAYRISLERSIIEPSEGVFSEIAIQKYITLFNALKNEGIEPWVTLHHFTNPQWFEDKGDFLNEENMNGFITFAMKMGDSFPMVQNWMTFNEPGIRGLEAYIRGEHPPQKQNILEAAHLIRNLLVVHTKTYKALKEKNSSLNIGITHQWLKFLPYSQNPLEKIIAYFYTNLIHTPSFNFFKNGEMEIKVPFKANIHLKYEDQTSHKIADFLGVQAYGFPRLKIGLNNGQTHPGASDKINNFYWFTAGSTCGEGGSMQYFGPPAEPNDLKDVLNEAFSIPTSRIPHIGITETGSDAKRMDFGEKEMKIDNEAQSKTLSEIFSITEKYPLSCLFIWTLNRHCEWLSGSMPNLGLTKIKNDKEKTFSYEMTQSLEIVQKQFQKMQSEINRRDVA